jgi:hypothetical protein
MKSYLAVKRFGWQQIVLIRKLLGIRKQNLLKLAKFVGENVAENENYLVVENLIANKLLGISKQTC